MILQVKQLEAPKKQTLKHKYFAVFHMVGDEFRQMDPVFDSERAAIQKMHEITFQPKLCYCGAEGDSLCHHCKKRACDEHYVDSLLECRRCAGAYKD